MARRARGSGTWMRQAARVMAATAGAAITAMTLVMVPALPASAAGLSVLDVEITAVDHATGNPQATAAEGIHGNRVAYRVDFSCGIETCTDTTVTITPPQPNPYGIAPTMTYLGSWGPNLLTYNTWTAPAGLPGASIGGDDTTGKIVSLGDVPAGFSGSFLVVYAFPSTVNRAIIPAQLYPEGFEIVHSATIASPNAPLSDSATAAPVVWDIDVPTPAIVLRNPGTVRPDVEVAYQIRMASGSMATGGGNIYGRAGYSAAGNHTVTVDLPPEAVFVSATGSPAGVYDPVAHTVTWTQGTEADPTACAGGGWGSTWANTWNIVNPCYNFRYVNVTYPASAFTADPSGCNFDVTVTPEVTVEATYLDAARTTRSATSPAAHSVSCYDPFGRINLSKDSTNDGGTYPPAARPVNIPPVVTGLTCDSSGFDDWGRACTPGQPLAPFGDNTKYWWTYAYNAGNVPGVATLVEDDLDLPGMPVNRIWTTATTPLPTIDYTYQCGTDPAVTGSAVSRNLLLSTLVGSATDCRFTSATVTSGELAAGNVRPSDTGAGTRFDVYFYYTVTSGTTPGVRTNEITATMSYPDYPTVADVSHTVTRDVNLRAWPTVDVLPGITAGFAAAPAVDGGGQAVPGRAVTFSVNGQTTRFAGANDFAPQYFFVAPEGWTIQDGSAAFAGGVPAGAAFEYRTVEIDGSDRDVVVASWPDGVTFGENVTLPTMTVVATPTYAVGAGTTSVANAWIGDSRNIWTNTNATFANARQDSGDADADGSSTDWVSSASQNVLVSAAAGVTVLKEICLPDGSPGDGCEWLGDPSQAVPVSTTATDIRYRITIRNTGNTTLSGVVAYDVLPYIGDVGTSDGTASTPRGSTFSETLVAIDAQSPGLDLTFSTSTNPPRPEVYSGATSGDWSAAETAAQAIRAAYPGTLAPGTSVSFSYSADVGDEATADSIACNSVAVDTASTVPAEPPAVCALTAEADLEIEVPERLPLQAGRPGILPFTVTNHGGSAFAPATVTIEIPAGVTVTSLTPAGWDCTASGVAPLAGPADLDCVPVDGAGAVTAIPLNVTIPLDVPVVVDAATAALCVPGEVSSRMVDPVLANNETEGCVTVVPFAGAVSVDKDDSRTIVGIGDEYSYQIEVEAALVGEELTGVVLTDELPANLRFVSASDGGVLSGANPDGTGGTVTWPATTLGATGEPSAGGDGTTGGTNTSFVRTVTVQVVAGASGAVVNLARVVAPDPADAGTPFEATDTDIDGLRRLTVTKTSDALPAGVRAGDEVEYTVVLTNSGTVDYTSGDPATVVDDLSDVLDDAAFVPGSATVEVGGTTSPLADPVAGLLGWSGALPVGDSAVLRYRVTVGDGSTGDLSLVNTAYSAGAVGSCVDGLDADGLSCATTSSPFAPVIDKRISSLEHNDDGTWTIVYDIDVTSLNPTADTVYDLTDTLAFGAGITVASASVTAFPAAVTPAAWSGSGVIAADAILPAGEVHSYRLTVVADAAAVAGTSAAVCATGVAGGFANVATLDVDGSAPEPAEACASPTAPTVAKSVASPVQQPDGSWLVTYTITVTNAATVPTTGLAYTLDDVFTVPAGVSVLDVTVTGPGGAPVNTGFDGAADTAILTGVDRVPAAPLASIPATRVYTVVFHTEAPAGTGTASAFRCPPAGTGGYANAVTLLGGSSSTVLGESSACADVAPLPTPQISKRVVQTSVDAGSGDWTLVYEIVVTNPSAQFSTVYNLVDELQFAADATVVSATMTSTDAAVSAAWDGVAQTAAVGAQTLPAGASDVFTVTVVADPSAVDVESASADCRLDAGESGTGFRNLATVTSGSASAFADACEPATDPSVVKATVGTPTQNASTGIWTLTYEVAVTNRSTTTVGGGIPYSVEDTLHFPAGVEIVDVVAGGSDGVVNAGFDGVDDTALATGSIEAAADESTPAQHTFTVTVRFRVPGGLTADLECSPTGDDGGLLNEAEITVGARVSGATACADVPDAPLPGITKSVLSQQQQADGTWLVLYRIQVGNPSATSAVEYDLDDAFQLGAGISVVGTPTVVAAPAGVSGLIDPDWDGAAETTLVEDILLPAGGAHSYSVRAVLDTGSLTSADAAADCVLDAGETATGLGNRATVGTSVAGVSAEACATIADPAVTKTVSGLPVQQADGSWIVGYTMTVSNPSALDLTYGLRDELDFPAGSTVTVESAAARAGGPAVESDWNGQTQQVLVATAALPASAVHVFDVSLRVVLPAGQGSQADAFANLAVVTSGPGGAVESDADAAADLEMPELVIEKTATSPAVARIGSTVQFEITVENVGLGDFTALYPAVVWDDLSGVLDDATLSGAVTVSPVTGAITTSGDRFSWRGALAAGAIVTLTYEVEIVNGGDGVLDNIAFQGPPAVPSPATPAECGEIPCDTTSTPLPAVFVEKSASAARVAPGGVLEYEIRITNTGEVDLDDQDPISVRDDLSDVLALATLIGTPTADRGLVLMAEPGFEWVGGLAAGESATITYSVRVDRDAADGAELVNVVLSDPTLVQLTTAGTPGPSSATTTTPIATMALTGATGIPIVVLGALALLSGGFLLLLLVRRRRAEA